MPQHQHEIIAIADTITAPLTRFLEVAGWDSIRIVGVLAECVAALSAYREEDHPLFPEVFVFGSRSACASLMPSGGMVKIGDGELTRQFAHHVLKQCAALATGGWAIYLVVDTQRPTEYGLFRSMVLPYSVAARESMVTLSDPTQAIVTLRNCARDRVEILAANGNRLEFDLGGSRSEATALTENLTDLSGIVCESLSVQTKEIAAPYFARFLFEGLRGGHGTLICVVAAECSSPVAGLEDGIWLPNPIGVAALLDQGAHDSATALADLLAAESLIRGMLSSDGIVVFGTDLSVRAFRVFVKPTEEEARKLDASSGARRRAHSILSLRVGTMLRAAYYQSQDGRTDYRSSP